MPKWGHIAQNLVLNCFQTGQIKISRNSKGTFGVLHLLSTYYVMELGESYTNNSCGGYIHSCDKHSR